MPKTTLKTPKYLQTYTNLYETFPGKHKVTKDEYRLIQKTFNLLLFKSITEEGKTYRLPFRLGILGVYTKDFLPGRIDYQHYKETGEKIQIRNLHSAQLVATCKLQFVDSGPTRSLYKFKLDRHPSRRLAHLIKHENTITKYINHAANIN